MLSQPLEQETVREGVSRRSILIVEDDPQLAEVLSVRLASQGFNTTRADNGHTALTMARTDRPSLILLDLGLPDVDGLELCEHLVDDPQTSDIPVIIVSGQEHKSIVRRARAAGCQYFVHKPYDPNALLVLIQQAIDDSLD